MTPNYRRFAMAILLSSALALLACASQSDQQYSLATEIIASHDINPDNKGRASPLAFMIYQLTDNEAFSAAGFDTLFTDGTDSLANTVVAKKQYQIQPGKRAMIDLSIAPGTQFIGVVAAFREQAANGRDNWSESIELSYKQAKKAKRYQTKIVFTGQQIKMYLVKPGQLSVF